MDAVAVVDSGCNECVNQGFSSREVIDGDEHCFRGRSFHWVQQGIDESFGEFKCHFCRVSMVRLTSTAT